MDWNTIILGNTVSAYVSAIVVRGILMGGIVIFKQWFASPVKQLAQVTGIKQLKFIKLMFWHLKTIPRSVYVILTRYMSVQRLSFDRMLAVFIDSVVLILVAYQIVRISNDLVEYLIKTFRFVGKKEDKTTVSMVILVVQIMVRVIAVLLILMNIGLEITPLLASLWIGGIAIAFALKSILEDVFSSFSIFLGKPFDIGDFVTIGPDSWTIMDIGLQTTRVKTLQWTVLTIPNKEVQNARINNFTLMHRRRVSTDLQISYEHDLDLLKKIPSILQDIVDPIHHVEFDRAHFRRYGARSLEYDLVYFVTSKDFKTYVDVEQEINFKIFEAFRKAWITFAYPTSIQYNKPTVSEDWTETKTTPKKQKSDLDHIDPVWLA